MAPEVAEAAIKERLKAIGERLDQASAIGKAANICADSGESDQAITIVLDVEQLIHEANTFLNAASLISRSVQS
jgi:hypothetical protein